MSELTIAGTGIRRDAEGRFSLNDLHRAAGGQPKHQPAFWLRNEQTTALVDELAQSSNSQTAPVEAIRGGSAPGTYVAKELVYAYAMWISPAFHLTVIRAYDQAVTAPADPMAVLSNPAAMRGLLLTYTEKVLALESEVAEQAPKVQALDRIATGSDGSLNITDAAKCLQMRPKDLFRWMQAHAWIYRRAGGVSWVAYQPRLQQGVLEHKVTVVTRSDGSEKVTEQVRVTTKGLARLSELLERHGIEV